MWNVKCTQAKIHHNSWAILFCLFNALYATCWHQWTETDQQTSLKECVLQHYVSLDPKHAFDCYTYMWRFVRKQRLPSSIFHAEHFGKSYIWKKQKGELRYNDETSSDYWIKDMDSQNGVDNKWTLLYTSSCCYSMSYGCY